MAKKKRSKYLIPAIAITGAGILGALALQSVAATGGQSYDCVNGSCVAVSGTGGQYATLAECQAACVLSPPTGCMSDADCPSGYQCVNGQCVPITTPPPPPAGGAYVIFNTDPPGGTATINGQLVNDNTTVQLPIGSMPIVAGPSPPDIPPFKTYQFVTWRLTYSSSSGWGPAPSSLFSVTDLTSPTTTLNVHPQPTNKGAYVYIIEAVYLQATPTAGPAFDVIAFDYTASDPSGPTNPAPVLSTVISVDGGSDNMNAKTVFMTVGNHTISAQIPVGYQFVKWCPCYSYQGAVVTVTDPTSPNTSFVLSGTGSPSEPGFAQLCCALVRPGQPQRHQLPC